MIRPVGELASHDQAIHLVSLQDDFNGSNHPQFIFPDDSYGINPAETIYQLTAFKRKARSVDANQILVRGMEAWDYDGNSPTVKYGDFSLDDLFQTAGGALDKFFNFNSSSSPGWIEFDTVSTEAVEPYDGIFESFMTFGRDEFGLLSRSR
jgi:hypothetical protein